MRIDRLFFSANAALPAPLEQLQTRGARSFCDGGQRQRTRATTCLLYDRTWSEGRHVLCGGSFPAQLSNYLKKIVSEQEGSGQRGANALRAPGAVARR
jgi:hypothetical protein